MMRTQHKAVNTRTLFAGAGKYLLPLVLAAGPGLLWHAPVQAVCSSYAGQATFNEYYFGNAATNFLEVHITNTGTVPQTAWQGWRLRVYTSSSSFTDYVLNDTTSTYCPFGNKAFITYSVPGGLPATPFAAVLRDATGNEIDYLRACGPPGSCSLPAFYTPDPGNCTAIDHDMVMSSNGNRDLSRFPDGSGEWDLSGGTGSGTNYTTCTTNTAGIAKSANVASVTIGSTFTFTLDVINNQSSGQTFNISDTIPAGFTYVSSVASQGSVDSTGLPTIIWNAGTVASGGGTASITITVRGTTLGTHTNVATITSPCLAGSCPSDSATVNVVAPAIDHYAISYPGGTPGITCEALAVQVTGHNSSHVASAPSASTTISLTTNPATNGWALRSGGGTFTAPNQYTFNGIETSAQFWLSRTTATTAPHININVSDGSRTEAATEDASVEFANAIFRFFAAGSPENIGTQIAGKNSDVAPGNQTLQLRAVRTSSTTSQCVAAIQGTTSVNMAYECNNPLSCTGSNLLNITSAVDSQTIARNNNAAVASYTPINMSFDASGIATFNMNYSDAGQITLHARKLLTAGIGTPPSTAATLVGASNAWVARPFGLDMDFSNDRATNGITGPSYAANATGSVFQTAGTAFNMSLRAVNWNASDDTDNDGVADACANLTDNSVTTNFGKETVAVTPANVTLGHTLAAPLPGTAGTVTTNSNSATFVNGVGVKSIDWSEVGILNLTSHHNNYLGSGSNIQGNVCNVGRFIPAFFSIANPVMTNRSDIVACADPFTYMNENFRTDYDLRAFNARTPAALTQNYTGAFAKLNTSNLLQMRYGATDTGTNLTPRLNVASAGVFTNGSAPVQATSFLARALAVDGPYNNFTVGVAPIDSDNVTIQSPDLSLDGGPNSHINAGQTSVRYGRLTLANNFGSELMPLSMQLSTQYYADATTQFITNNNDNCTAITTASVLLFNSLEPKQGRAVGNSVININGGNTTTLGAMAPMVNGITSLNFSAPNTRGYVDVEVLTPAYLLSDLDAIDQGIQGPALHCTPGMAITEPAFIPGCVSDALTLDDVPIARGTFGIFRGSDRVIYIRETY